MALMYKKDGHWMVGGRKHEGRTLQEVASLDPNYLQWMHKEASTNLSDEAYYALSDTMETHGIEKK
jgi:hypothetical protein